MTLFSAPADPWSHRTRLVLAEKGIAIELVNVDPQALPEDLIDLNPYHSVPTLVDRDWYALAHDIELDPSSKTAEHSRKVLGEAICASAEVFKAKPFFLSDEFSLVDASIAPILWRLPSYGIELPVQAQPIVRYMNTIFARPAFRASLSVVEREMRR